jgi:type VI secretion system protein ImpC
MPARIGFDFQVGPGRDREPLRSNAESPMRILLVGDFSGRNSRGAQAHGDIATRKPLAVDIDNFDRVMQRIAPRLALGTQGTELEFTTIDEFHPDALYRRIPAFQRLRELRERMQNPSTSAAAAAEFGMRGGESDSDTLSRLVGLQSSAPTPRRAELASLDALIAGVVAPHIVRDVPHQAMYLGALDAAIGDEMRAILVHPQFKALEALWRGAYWLASSLETDEELKLYLLDVSASELAADMHAAEGAVESSSLYRLLAGAPDADPWSLIVGDFAFGPEAEDLQLLAYLGAVASRTGAPFIGSAKPQLLGAASFAATPDPRDWAPAGLSVSELWNALRESSIAPWIALTAPRALIRLPFGKSGEPIEAFAFEEVGRGREHESYAWANGALACALLIGRAFSARGWDMELGDELEIDDMPAHVFEDDGEKRLQPCAEAALTERAGETMVEAGLIPLLSYKNRNAIRVMRFQSIAKPAQALRGPWR